MRERLVIGGVCLLAASFWGCGAERAVDSPKTPEDLFGVFTDTKGDGEPHFDVPRRPPLKKPLVRDIKVGKGAVARKGKEVLLYYVRADYKTGAAQFTRWPPQKPLEWRLFAGAAWEREIEGMRAGGRREMLIPSRLAFGEGAVDYIFDLVAVSPASASARALPGA